jgi:pimeloyl-ACP methyl ester carboxylesterase
MRVPVHLIAHSFGSSVAMRLANAAPERVASVTLYDPVVAVSSAAGLGLPPALMVLSDAMRAAAPAQAMQRFIDFWAGEGAWAATPDWRREALAWKHPSVLRDFQQLLSGDWTPDRIAYRGPLTVLRGGKSPSVIRATTDHLVRTYPCVSCHVMPGLDHMTPLAQPQITDNLFLKCVIAQAQQIKPALAA